jgi:hypothetical protein
MNILFVGFSVDACPRIWWFHVRRYDDLSDDIFSLFSWIKLDWLLVQPQLMMQAVGKQFNLRLWMKWWMYMNQPNAVFPQVHCERQLSMWHMYFYVILCLNVVMFNISFVFETFASHPQPPNEGLGVPCPKQGTTTWIANPTWSKKCMQIYLPVRVVIQRLNPQCCAIKKLLDACSFMFLFVCI